MSDLNTVTEAELPGGQPNNLPRGPVKKDKPRSLAGDAWADLRKRKVFWTAVVLVIFVLTMALFPKLFTSADPGACSLSNQFKGPAGSALFGYDFQGCDIYAKIVNGAWNSIKIGVLSTLISGLIGLIFGLAAGYFGGATDAILSRIIDIMLGVPFLLAGIVLSRRLSSDPKSDGVLAVTLTLGLLTWTSGARVMRSAVISAKQQDYVAAARMLGAKPSRLMLRHILPNSIASYIVMLTLLLGINISSEATLSFLGVGLKNGAISWGIMISEGTQFARTQPWPLVWPAIFLAVTVLAFIMLGDAIRDAFDPKLR
ncbi:ABC-type dipeptide/oligopeptide/nickel transport system permease subunit [Actinoplanes octamycinicus]|uniref:ABC-type dipeptide/oligopeptide/nickel transport system permease subunit n=1 Tax=Actinoplanes octamycinicus TaxID=135948 RepID=A0A7W7M6K6_9ACTN|nr:ABC transporter permease [Actinoplanes octamycinicus]MBB4738932.1 ABC-type dipeptide/oligopeptide/nickel transport system permease subunit [Actinoplanes octamycinicus]GIE63307.1 peptide ABC transporter permease [Actinoplanes octamycinicus]